MDLENQEHEAEQGDGASREDLLAAVREAGGTGSVDVEAEERAAVERAAAPTEATEQTEQAADEEPAILAKLKAREEEHAKREAARSHADELIARAREESERMIREARERADREWQAEIERRRQEFLASPTAHLRALGDPQQIVDAVMKDGTPEARAMAQLQRELAETKQKAAGADEVKQAFEAFKQEQAREQHMQLVEQVKAQFLQHASAEKAPHLHARLRPRRDLREGRPRCRSVARWRAPARKGL
jgi:hypothetical protein